MKYKIIFFSMLLISGFQHLKSQQLGIIPEPFQITQGNGFYTLPTTITIDAPISASEVSNEIINQFNTVTGHKTYSSKQRPTIQLSIVNDDFIGNEGYYLNVNAKGIQIKAKSNAGFFYAWQTIKQLLPTAIYATSLQSNVKWQLPFVVITDKPRFAWRGLMLDVSRHFFSVADVKRYIDNMVAYKYNLLHLHLSDDQGWRIEIKSLPKLTEVGAWRAERNGKWANTKPATKDEPKTYGGFYTQDQIKELVVYAKSKHVEIMPEIDIPGHSMAILAAYPNLSTTPNYNYQVNVGDEFIDWAGPGGHTAARIDNNLNPANEDVYAVLDKIFTEVATLFPFEYIHTGGDECAKNNWEKSTDVQALMKREGLKNQNEVQSYFTKRVEKIIKSKGKNLMGWDEILEGGIPEDAAVMSWRGVNGGIEAAKQKHKVVMTPSGYNYIDFYQGELTAEGRVYGGLRMKKVYSFDPVPEGIDSTLILGNQANLWTEQVFDFEYAQYMTWPRALAIAETNWSPKYKKNWKIFADKVEQQFERFDKMHINYAKSMFDPIVTTQLNTKGELIVSMDTEANGLTIHYTINDQVPNTTSNVYNKPVVIPEDVSVLSVIAYRHGQQIGKMLRIPIESLKSRAIKVL